MDIFVIHRISARFACVLQPSKANNLKTTQIFFPIYSRVIHCLSLLISMHSQPLHDLGLAAWALQIDCGLDKYNDGYCC